MPRIAKLLLLLSLPGLTTACGHHQVVTAPPGAPIDEVLGPQVTPAFQSTVLVLGTPHLDGDLQPGHLAAVLDRLERFAPTRIAIEALTPDEIALLGEREVHDSAAAQVLSMFGRGILTAGRTMQSALSIDRVGAERRADGLLESSAGEMPTAEHVALVGLLLAAYDYHSAVLHWSALLPAVRAASDGLPAGLSDLLDRRLSSPNEIVTLATALAHRLGHSRLYPIDSQYDGVRTLSAPPAALRELFTDPARGAVANPEEEARAERLRAEAFAAGNLLPLYLYMNEPAYQRRDLTQWNWLFRVAHSTGLDRVRYAMWELRNLRQATAIIEVAASERPERVLVVVGASHKAYLDRILATQLGVRLIQLRDL